MGRGPFSPPDLPALSRRTFLSTLALTPAFLRQLPAGSRFVATIPLGNPGGFPSAPFGRLLGTGLDARQFTDLSAIGNPQSSPAIRNSQSAIPPTATDLFFIRTACPPRLQTDAWSLQLAGRVRATADLTMRDIEKLAPSSGRYLIECSGNADQSNYGLMSVADWDGVPLAAVLDRVRPLSKAYRVLVSGVDDETTPSRTSVPGASWIFTRDELARALLATRMNGAPLTGDHGFPVRLIVPGWYGCSCIKWVNRIELVEESAAPTSQMVEFAARTHQSPEVVLARDFTPAVIDTAAMPVRVEKWIVDGKIAYRVTGILWGGSKPTNRLQIRFRANLPWTPVDDCPLPASSLSWSTWSHTWRPAEPGRYQIVLRVDDPSIRTRRLDIFFYVREIQIDEV